MNVSLLTKYTNYSYPTRAAQVKPPRLPQSPQPAETAQPISDSGAAANKSAFINPQQIKRVGYTELNGSWDQFMLSRFVELIERNTGSTLDAGAIMRKYDADGDGLLNTDEQTAMIEGLTEAEIEGRKISQTAAENIIEQLKELSNQRQDEPKYATGILRAVRRYERMFFYDNRETPEELAV